MAADRSGFLRTDPAGGSVLGALVVAGGDGATMASDETLRDIRDDVNERHQKFDYYIPSGSPTTEVRYIGSAPQGTLSSSAGWTVRRLSHAMHAGEARVTDIQTLTGIWDDRASLPWS